MLAHALQFAIGLAVLVLGAEFLIRGAVGLARRFGVSPFVIGLTLVGFGTSAPELVVTLSSSLNGKPDLAIGNVVGSNIANVGLILAVAAIIRPLACRMRILKVELPIMVGVGLLLWFLGRDGEISRLDGAVFLAGFAGVMGYLVLSAKAEPAAVQAELGEHVQAIAPVRASLVFVILGLVALVGGAELMVRAAVEIARGLGVSELVIGLTVLAVGTSLPELASTVAAARRGESDIALGNVVGSNIFNVLLILGTTAVAVPLPVSEQVIRFELPVMNGFAVLLVVVAFTKLTIVRWEGAVLLAAYVVYVVWEVMGAGQAQG